VNAVTEVSFGKVKVINTEIIEEVEIGWVTPPSVRARPSKVTLHGQTNVSALVYCMAQIHGGVGSVPSINNTEKVWVPMV
jgi:hypothetical protein